MKKASFILLIFLFPFFAFPQKRYDVVIDEIMADPSPSVGLPNNEWIELKNTTTMPINLEGWHLSDHGGQSGAFPDFILQPGSLVIVCANSALTAMSAFGTTISITGFPSLDNNGDLVFLSDSNSNVIHAVNYSDQWYQNELKRNGGWTLEMIDTKNPCEGSSNWTACINPQGGTPGARNSVDGINSDQISPKLKNAYAIDSLTIIAVFDESLDSLRAVATANYSIDGGVSIGGVTILAPLFNSVQLKLNTPLLVNTIYTLLVNNVTDCSNNAIGSSNHARLGLAVEAFGFDIVINEILFDPKANGYDYIEFYNKSDKIFNASKLFAANRNTAGDVSSIEQISSAPYYIFPGDYFVITENAASLEMNSLVKNPDAVIELTSLPSYPDDRGDVILLNGQGDVVDEVKYSKDWQFKLLDNAEGVSLERIDPAVQSQEAANWHSAASTAGYGTPGYKNSQYMQTLTVDATIDVAPKIFSPDNDGYDDLMTIQYKVPEPGYVANITIFDSQGRPVRYFVKNGILGLEGMWHWDGLDENGNRLAIGVYIIYMEIFNLKGKKQDFKHTVVLARRLN